ncbi:helix-turn-helix transcriptional regulator [Nocardioides sp. CN2-186]|uniref:helix-turn-helix transcriptional regulator n=1 Tax=Nocardioides tweenelious TaxID=3156607 RepID=UPI0032B4F9D5
MTAPPGSERRRTLAVRPRLGEHDHLDPPPSGPASDPDRLGELLGQVAELVDQGTYDTDEREGVLLDVTLGRVRCVIVEQEPPLRVTLSPRERQIALMVAHGRTNQAIATSLEISVWTVSTHLRRIFAKLAVSSRAEMVARLLADHDYSPLVAPDAR